MSRGRGLAIGCAAAVLALACMTGPSQAAQTPPATLPLKLSAATTNLGKDSDVPIRIDLLRLTSDEDRRALIDAAREKGVESLQSQLAAKPSLGFLWTDSSVGYLIRYAARSPLPGGGERIVIATDRVLGSYGLEPWQPAPPTPATSYPFTVIELHLDSKGTGDGTFSLAARIEVDATTSTLGLEQSKTVPRLLKNVKREGK